MITPSAEELEQQVRDFIQRIPRRKADFGGSGSSGSARSGPSVEDGPRNMALDSADMPTTQYPSATFSSPQLVDVGKYSFQGANASEDSNPLLLIYDGLIGTPADQQVPDGMGADNFVIDVSDGDEVFIGVTYDTDTFEITSRYIDVGGTPDDEFGAFYVKIIDIRVEFDDDGNASVFPTNARCGDIIIMPIIIFDQASPKVVWLFIAGEPVDFITP